MFKRLFKKRKCFKIIKKKLTNEFKVVYIINREDAKKLYSLLTNPKRILPVVKARIDEKKEIHIIIKDIYGVYYITKTSDYEWFLNCISFNPNIRKDNLII